MKLKTIFIFLLLIILSGNNFISYCQNPQSSQPNVQAQKIKDQILKIGIANELTITPRLGKKHHGTIVKIEEDHFEMVEVDLKQIIKINYSDLKKVRKGYGQKNMFGKRISPQTNVIVGAVIFAWTIAGVMWGISQTR